MCSVCNEQGYLLKRVWEAMAACAGKSTLAAVPQKSNLLTGKMTPPNWHQKQKLFESGLGGVHML